MSRPDSNPYSCAPCIEDENFTLRNGIEVTLTNENIEDIDADIVVTGHGGDAAKSLEGKGGTTYDTALKTMTSTMRKPMSAAEKILISCDAGPQLKCRKVYYASVAHFSRDAGEWSKHLTTVYKKASALALQDRARKVAVVLIGAGKAGGPTRESVRAALEAFSSLPDPGCLTQLLLVERDERRTREAVKECQDWVKEHPAPARAGRTMAEPAEEDPEICNSMLLKRN